MATALNLFPSRIAFVNPDGTLTPEAFRALQTLSLRVGGPLGDNGVDVFADTTGYGTQDSSITDTVIQPTTPQAHSETVSQPVVTDWVVPDVMQPASVFLVVSPVTSVTGTAPVSSSGGVTPAISMAAATSSVPGYLTSTDWAAFNGKQPAGSYQTLAAPVTKTADWTVANSDVWFINNKAGSTATVTIPAASLWTGRALTFKNLQAQAVVSASSNVTPLDSTTAGTSILLPVVGNWATLVSDGTNWVTMQAAPNNILLTE